MQDRIEKHVRLNAPIERVWQALTDHEQFGAWFRAQIDEPFEVGKVARGRITYPGYEHLPWVALIRTMDAPRTFAFSWCTGNPIADVDFAVDLQTLVQFTLEETANGTALTITESGFSKLPADVRDEAWRSNSGGWQEQTANIAAYVA
jgi:uncharacterized protein YndB with AHSA1/START domain